MALVPAGWEHLLPVCPAFARRSFPVPVYGLFTSLLIFKDTSKY